MCWWLKQELDTLTGFFSFHMNLNLYFNETIIVLLCIYFRFTPLGCVIPLMMVTCMNMAGLELSSLRPQMNSTNHALLSLKRYGQFRPQLFPFLFHFSIIMGCKLALAHSPRPVSKLIGQEQITFYATLLEITLWMVSAVKITFSTLKIHVEATGLKSKF